MSRRSVLAGLGAVPLLAGAREGERFDPAPTVRDLARRTRGEYHDAAVGAAIAERLLASLRAGRFGAPSATALAERLNAEIAAASGDAHFVVMHGVMADMRPVPPTDPHRQTAPLSPAELRHLRRENFGAAAAELLPGNVGRIAIRPQFYRPAAEVRRRLAEAMSFLSDSWGLIVDLSETIGGDPNSVALFLSYFFDRPPFPVNRFRWRNLPVEEFRTTADPGGPRYGEQRPVAVLVSGSTYSAGEEFAYDVQALRRGVIVGGRTPGAANHALPIVLAGEFTAFIPMARAENPVTGTNWEGIGVRPDIEADPTGIAAAHRAVLERLAASGVEEKSSIARRLLSEG